MNKTLRSRILTKLAQASTPDNLPTQQVAQTQTVSGSPPGFIASNYYPIVKTFSARNAPIINGLSNVLNQVLYYSSNGQVHLQWMRSNGWNFGTSAVPSVDLRNMMEFTKQVYLHLYTNQGEVENKALSVQEIADRVAPLKSSQYLNNMSSTNLSGQVATKIGGNVKTIITNYLLQIK